MPSTPFAYPQVKLQIRDGVRFAAAPPVKGRSDAARSPLTVAAIIEPSAGRCQ